MLGTEIARNASDVWIHRSIAILGYWSSGVFTVFILTLALFFSFGGVDWNGFGIFLGFTMDFLISIGLAALLVLAHHIYHTRPWMKWTRSAYVVGGVIGFAFAFWVLIFIAIAGLIGSCGVSC